MKQRIYIIDWIDSAGNPGWKHLDELDVKLAICQTVGFFVAEDKEKITLALSRNLIYDYAPYGDLISIPKVAIKKKRKIAVSL